MPLDATTAALTEEVQHAREAIIDYAKTAPQDWWDPYELKLRARNGWSSGAMTLAMNDLIDEGVLEVGERLLVRLRN